MKSDRLCRRFAVMRPVEGRVKRTGSSRPGAQLSKLGAADPSSAQEGIPGVGRADACFERGMRPAASRSGHTGELPIATEGEEPQRLSLVAGQQVGLAGLERSSDDHARTLDGSDSTDCAERGGARCSGQGRPPETCAANRCAREVDAAYVRQLGSGESRSSRLHHSGSCHAEAGCRSRQRAGQINGSFPG